MEIVADSHEWVRKEGNCVVVGITKKSAKEIGEIVFVSLPKVGEKIQKGDEVVVLESTKAAIDSCAPLSGEVVEVNSILEKEPKWINSDPENKGWLYKIKF